METVENIEALTHSELLKYCIYLQEKLNSFQINFQKTSFSNEKLKHELDQLKKLVFGTKHERFVPTVHLGQLPLELNIAPTESTVVVATKEITYTRQQVEVKKEKNGRMKLPADLPREVHVIEPLEDVSGMKKIGEEITEELDMVPNRFFVRQ